MSESNLHIFGPEAIRETNRLLRASFRSEASFKDLLRSFWGDSSQYTHKQFIKDYQRGVSKSPNFAERWASKSPKFSNLTWALVSAVPHEIVPTHFCLRSTFHEGYWFPSAEDLQDEDGFVRDDRVAAFLDLRYGVRPPKGLLSRRVIEETRLVAKLCGRQRLPNPTGTKYPLWIIGASTWMEGYLTSRETRKLSPDHKSGFFAYLRRAMAYAKDPTCLEPVVAAYADARQKNDTLGRRQCLHLDRIFIVAYAAPAAELPLQWCVPGKGWHCLPGLWLSDVLGTVERIIETARTIRRSDLPRLNGSGRGF